MARTVTAEQKAKSQERRERFRKLAKSIADMSDAQRSDLAASIVGLATVEGRALSFHNTCLIATQLPTATLVGGFRQWIKAGRAVRKGEHGLMIWVPIVRKSEPSPDSSASLGKVDETRFMCGTVFDVSQTDEIESSVAIGGAA